MCPVARDSGMLVAGWWVTLGAGAGLGTGNYGVLVGGREYRMLGRISRLELSMV